MTRTRGHLSLSLFFFKNRDDNQIFARAFYYYCFHRNDFDILFSRLDDLFPVVSRLPHLGIEKIKACQYRVLDPCAVHTPFLVTSSLPHIKRVPLTPQSQSESDMYVCDLCNWSFSTQGSLKRHRESVHRQSGDFSCRVCGQRFYRKDHLGRHLKTHQAACPTDKTFVDLLPPPPSPVPPPESHGERPVCDLCATTFASQKTLKRHRETIHGQSDGFSC